MLFPGSDRRRGIARHLDEFDRLWLRFIRSNGPDETAAIGSFWRRMRETPSSKSPPGLQIELEFIGWISRQSPCVVRTSFLRAHNPRYLIKVSRTVRPDVSRGSLRHGLRAGFRVTAFAPTFDEPFQFVLRDPGGLAADIPASNPLAEHRMRVVRHETGVPAGSGAVVGHIDQVGMILFGPSVFHEIVSRRPAQVLRLIGEASLGQEFAPDITAILRQLPVFDREADQADLISRGGSADVRSDLSKVRVRRLYNQAERREALASQPRRPVPHPLRTAGRIDYADGPITIRHVSPKWHTFTDATVRAGGVVLSDGAIQVYEWAADPVRDFIAGQTGVVFSNALAPDLALVGPSPEHGEGIDQAILLSGRADANWYHWMLEYLPRVMTIPPSISLDVPIAVTQRTPVEGIRALRALTDRPIIFWDPASSIRVRTLHVRAPTLQVLDTPAVPWSQGLALEEEPIRALASRLMTVAAVQEREPRRRIFLSRRSGHRGLRNEKALAAIARGRGLEVIDPSQLSWAEQVRTFAAAQLVVGAGGAVMANYVFMPPGSYAISLISDALDQFVLPAVVANLGGARFRSIVGRANRDLDRSQSRLHWMHGDFRVPERVFESELDLILTELT